MRNIKLTIEYDGKKYLGWQRLGDSDKTIQGKIETVLNQMTDETIEIVGSGRTDAGTHAYGQVANFKTESKMTVEKMQLFLNNQLPNDIVIKEIVEVPERFHARYNAKSKQYSYQVWNSEVPTALHRNHSYHYANNLDLEKINEACEFLIGEHDFIGFSSLKKTKKSTIRTITSAKIATKDEMITFTFTGEGFLYNMVRIIVGTLLEVGDGTKEVSAIEEILNQKDRQKAGHTVPAQGLFLDRVSY
ncbi:tRNA pseudouridine(38-40) synthase TruA [Vagococcus coleopterorum]|uniref:tRNA pseudouridine synthase A n=1 Tax=Vagococcus coleopterorum TaxID=2714946 RepID=A0A6G8ALG1_9ENTE|nr:tRNA pseudouridine(38-40) synthase TruA [Vagococcus coleopterorum]QIL45763.1 tRNA pseudouridine(38-40) synthase TruA [Vagococcus coleopterorum]